MNTEQSYVGGANDAPNPRLTVKSDQQTPPTADERQPLTKAQICNSIDIISGLLQQGRLEEVRNCLNSLKAEIAEPVGVGESITQTPPTADQRQRHIEENGQYIDKDFEEMLSIVADLNASTSGRHPITVVADLLEYWLSNANPNFVADQYLERMKGALSLISAWRQLGSLSESIYYLREEISQLQKEGGTNSLTPPIAVAPTTALGSTINLPVYVMPDTVDRRSELHLVRDALQFYSEHLRQVSDTQQNPNLLIDAANVDDILENLTQQAFDTLGDLSQQLVANPPTGQVSE